MSFLSKIFRPEPLPPIPASGIRSATGLPRSAIASYYRSNGLFGRDSDLSVDEQRVIRRRLGPLPGVPEVAAADRSRAPSAPRLQDVADYVDALIAGRDTLAERARLARSDVSPAAQSEIERTIQNVQDIFGPRSIPAESEVRETVIPEAAFARAA